MKNALTRRRMLNAAPNECRDQPENYLHAAALPGEAPSKTRYDPNQAGAPLAGLGVHEHRNNPTDRQYSRNRGKREGIELVVWPPRRPQERT
jgi:hypothetical protein